MTGTDQGKALLEAEPELILFGLHCEASFPSDVCSRVSLAACVEGTVRSARFVDPPSGMQLEYTLKSAHAYLAEYHRTLRVVFDHTQMDFPLEMDTGGYLRMNIYRWPDRRLLLFDGLAHIVIDPRRETIEEVMRPRMHPQPNMSAVLIGHREALSDLSQPVIARRSRVAHDRRAVP